MLVRALSPFLLLRIWPKGHTGQTPFWYQCLAFISSWFGSAWNLYQQSLLVIFLQTVWCVCVHVSWKLWRWTNLRKLYLLCHWQYFFWGMCIYDLNEVQIKINLIKEEALRNPPSTIPLHWLHLFDFSPLCVLKCLFPSSLPPPTLNHSFAFPFSYHDAFKDPPRMHPPSSIFQAHKAFQSRQHFSLFMTFLWPKARRSEGHLPYVQWYMVVV